jgi:hypothetical protein
MASSVIREARYFPDEQALELCFSSGRRYLYLAVPTAIAEDFQRAESKGAFFNSTIKSRFRALELKDRRRMVSTNG